MAASARLRESRRRTTTPSSQYMAPKPMYRAVSSESSFLGVETIQGDP
jgi:hypothetical protein